MQGFLSVASLRRIEAGKRKRLGMKVARLTPAYSVSVDQLHAMYIKQDMVCRICKQPKTIKELKIDHCHKTRKVRGLLCHQCNTLLGMAKDNKLILAAAIEYLS
jgi:hypothetical protein